MNNEQPQPEHVGNPKDTSRLLLIAVTVLVVAASASIGGLFWLKQTTDRTIEKHEQTIAAIETEMAEIELSLEGATKALSEARSENEELIGANGAQALELTGVQRTLGELQDGVVDYVGVSLAMALGTQDGDTRCVAEAVIEDQGSALAVLELFTEGASTSVLTGNAVVQLGASIFRAAEECGAAIPALTSLYVESIAAEADVTGFYLDPGSSVDPGTLIDAVGAADRAGARLYIVVLSQEPDISTADFADSMLQLIGNGTVLVIGPETVGVASLDSSLNSDDIDAAVNASVNAASDNELIRTFVSELFG